MITIAAELLLIAVLPALLVMAAVWDLGSFTIPNVLPGSMGLLFVLFIVLVAVAGHHLTLDFIGLHMAAALVALAGGMVLFGMGYIGGGDAKLFAMASLWLGWHMLLEYTLFASLLGGALTLGVLALRRVPLPSSLHGQAWLLRLADRHEGVPYGIALAVGALAVLPHSELFLLAAGG